MKYKIGVKEYYKPTPKVWRIVGDVSLAGSAVIGIAALFVPGAKWVVIGGILVKVLSNFASKYDN